MKQGISLPTRRTWVPDGSQGFTLIEAMVTVAIIAIALGIAVPSYDDVILRLKTRRAVEELTATLYFARAEAIKRGGNVTIARQTPAGCAAGELPGDWNCGWVVFIDSDNSGSPGPDETILQTAYLANNVRVWYTSNARFIRADRWGQFAGNGNFGFVVHPGDNHAERYSTVLCMSAGGRLRTLREASRCPKP